MIKKQTIAWLLVAIVAAATLVALTTNRPAPQPPPPVPTAAPQLVQAQPDPPAANQPGQPITLPLLAAPTTAVTTTAPATVPTPTTPPPLPVPLDTAVSPPSLTVDYSLWRQDEGRQVDVGETAAFAAPVMPGLVISPSLQADRIVVPPGYRHEFVKIGFHVGSGGGNVDGLGEWMRELDRRGIPFFLKSADAAGPLYEAQELMRASGVPHVLVFRRSVGSRDVGMFGYDVPLYHLSPVAAARRHWDLHMAEWPPELDPSLVWIETINEVDKNRSAWLGVFATEQARLAIRDGFRYAAFGWAAGEPEMYHWQQPSMQAFLKLAADYPDQIAIALHEYSYVTDRIDRQYPFLVGRFQHLFWVADSLGLDRPTVLITEWGWTHNNVPDAATAMEHIEWAASLYALYPEVKGAVIWYLGPGFGGIANQAQQLIRPLTDMAATRYYVMPDETFSAVIE